MLDKQRREEMIAWLMINQGCSHEYWERQTDQVLQVNYKNFCIGEDGSE